MDVIILLKKINFYYLFSVILILFFLSILHTYDFIVLYNYSHWMYVLAGIGLIIAIINYKKRKFCKCDLYLLIMFIFALISTIFSASVQTSLYGFQGRNEGLLTFVSYYIFFIIASFLDKKDKIKILYLILIIGSLHVFYGLLQILGICNTVIDGTHYAAGFLRNSVFYGTLMVICFTLSLCLFLFKNQKRFIIFLIIFTLGVISSVSMGAILSAFISFIIIIAYLIKKKKIKTKKVIITLLCFIIFALIINLILKNRLFRDIFKFLDELKNILAGNMALEYGSERLFIWQNTLKRIPYYLLHGVGIDCFIYAFDGNLLLPLTHKFVDKAHNEYLQTLLTQGIFGFISYILFIVCIFKNNLKQKKPILLFVIISYLIQATFNISVINVAYIFYIILGLSYDRNLSKKI